MKALLLNKMGKNNRYRYTVIHRVQILLFHAAYEEVHGLEYRCEKRVQKRERNGCAYLPDSEWQC